MHRWETCCCTTKQAHPGFLKCFWSGVCPVDMLISPQGSPDEICRGFLCVVSTPHPLPCPNPSGNLQWQTAWFMLFPSVCRYIWEQSSISLFIITTLIISPPWGVRSWPCIPWVPVRWWSPPHSLYLPGFQSWCWESIHKRFRSKHISNQTCLIVS